MADQIKIAKPKGQASKPAAQIQRKERSKGMRAESSASSMGFLNGIQGGAVQAKVKVGPANDKFEVEADQMADKVMRMSEPGVQRKPMDVSSTGVDANGLLQRSESEENETPVVQKKEQGITRIGESSIQAKELTNGSDSSLRDRISRIPQARPSTPSNRINRKEEDEEIQRKSGSEVNKGPPVGGTFSTKLNQSKGSGQAMDNSTNSFMSSRFGTDFSGVRIHTGGSAQNMSDSINAKAFTHRNDIYFNKGQYQPGTSTGKTLLAHELTHTIQQGAVGGSVQPKLKLGAPDDKHEREADAVAAQVMRKPKTSIQRKCASCEEETVQRSSKHLSRGPPEIQRKSWEKDYTSEEEPIQRKKQTNPVRGPDVTGGIIQRDIFDDIGGAVSGAADFVGDSLDAGIDYIKEELNELAEDVTGFELLTVVIAKNPITVRDVTRNGRNFMDAGLEVIPNGDEYKRKMQEDGGYEDGIAWIDEQLELIDFTVWDVLEDFEDFIGDLGLSDVRSPGAALQRGLRVFGHYIDRLFTFAENVASKLLEIVKDLAVNALLEWVRDETPWYPLLTVVLEEDPITGEEVERNGLNILTGFILLHPEGEAQLAQMEESGSLERAAEWVDEAIIRVTRIAEGLANGFTEAWEDFTITDLLTPVDTFMEIYELFSAPVTELIDFAIEVAKMILQFIKDALVARLVEYARTIPGYSLITVMLGKDIFSEERVDRTPKNIIKGFMELVPGGAEKFQELDQTGAIDDAVSWIEGAIEELDLTWDAVVLIFTTAWNDFSLADLATPFETFGRVMDLFAAPVYRVIRFVAKVVIKLVEIALRIMGFPFELIGSIISRAQQAYEEIKRDPIQFLKNVLRAVKQGFIQFFNNIVTHLLNGVGEWLFGQMGDAGITIPEDFSFQSILKMVFEILGVTREKIFEKIREKVGPERWAQIEGAIDTLTGVWTFVNDVLTRGPIAIWEKIQEQLSGLWDMVISAARNWIMTKIIQQVTVKLLSFLDPTGIMAVVNSFIAFFNAIQSAIQYMIPMLEMLNSFLGGVIQIAQGNIQPAADLLESTMAQGMPILIGFLANQVGLGSIGRKIGEVIESLQEKVDEGIQWLIDKAWEIGASILESAQGLLQAGRDLLFPREQFVDATGNQHSIYMEGEGANARLTVASDPTNFLEYVNQFTPAAGSPEAAAKTDAIASAGRLDAMRVRVVGQTDATGASTGTSDVRQEFTDEIAVLAGHMSIFTTSASGPVATSAIQFGPPTNGFGKSATVEKLTQNHPPGGQPASSLTTPDWNILRMRKNSLGSYYVRAHLLNHTLGGTGDAWANLTPLRGTDNTDMSSNFEEYVKTAVNSPANGGRMIAVRWHVSADYSSSPSGGAASSQADAIIADSTDPRHSFAEQVRTTIDAESRIPGTISCTAEAYDAHGTLTDAPHTSPANFSGNSLTYTVTNRVDQSNIDNYDFEGTPAPSPGLIHDSTGMTNAGVPANEADRIARAVVSINFERSVRVNNFGQLPSSIAGTASPHSDEGRLVFQREIPSNLDQLVAMYQLESNEDGGYTIEGGPIRSLRNIANSYYATNEGLDKIRDGRLTVRKTQRGELVRLTVEERALLVQLILSENDGLPIYINDARPIPAGIEGKLINPSNGYTNKPRERQADRMANRVVQMKTADIQRKCDTCEEEEVQRKCASCKEEKEETVQRKCSKCDDEENIQRTVSGKSGGSSLSSSFQGQLNSSKGSGSPMDTNTRSFMENRFGNDFGGVSIHTGQKASALNEQIGARAFTTGSDIYFNQGEYNPNSREGKRLLAHELTHTIQQGATSTVRPKIKSPVRLEPERKGAKACMVHLHSNEKTAFKQAKKIYSSNCVNLVSIDNGGARNLTFEVPGFAGTNCVIDPNRIFSRTGIEDNWDARNGRKCKKAKVRAAGITEIERYRDSELNPGIRKCRGNSLPPNKTSGIQGIHPIVALHNNSGFNPAKHVNSKSGGGKRHNLNIHSYVGPSGAESSATEDSATILKTLTNGKNPHIEPKEDRDNYLLVTKVKTFNDLVAKKRNVVLQKANLPDDGSLSVIAQNDSYTNIEAQHGRKAQNEKMATDLFSTMNIGPCSKAGGKSKVKTRTKTPIQSKLKNQTSAKGLIQRDKKEFNTIVNNPYPTDVKTKQEKIDYLLGKYKITKANRKANWDTTQPKMQRSARKPVMVAYLAMKKMYKKETGDTMILLSPRRDHGAQKDIWDQKFKFTRKGDWGILESKKEPVKSKCADLKIGGTEWNENGPNHKKCWNRLDESEKAKEILKTSSAPGISRHHMGTDVDLWNVNINDWEKPPYIKRYDWLRKNAARFGFYQAYNSATLRDHKGYAEEKWHWSYRALALPLYEEYVRLITAKEVVKGKPEGAAFLAKNYNEYVQSIHWILKNRVSKVDLIALSLTKFIKLGIDKIRELIDLIERSMRRIDRMLGKVTRVFDRAANKIEGISKSLSELKHWIVKESKKMDTTEDQFKRILKAQEPEADDIPEVEEPELKKLENEKTEENNEDLLK